MSRQVLVVADRPDGEGADRDLTSLLAWLDEHGWRSQLLVWDRADLGPRLERHRRVQEIEAINRWRLPQVLERLGLHAAKRRLRNLRIRLWWRGSRRARVALLWGPLRPEVQHYLPPRVPRVGDLVGARRAQPGPDLATTVELADHLLLARGDRVLTTDAACTRVAARIAPAAIDAPLTVAGWGPSAHRPLEGAEAFLRLVWAIRSARPDLDVRGLWTGGDERSPTYRLVRYERRQLGLDDVVSLLDESSLGVGLADQVHVVALTHDGAPRTWPTAELRRAGVPVLAFDRVRANGLPVDLVAPWPDLAALADAVTMVLDEVQAGRADLARLLERLASP